MNLQNKITTVCFNDHVKNFRKKNGESRRSFSERYGWSPTTTQNYENFYDVPLESALLLGHHMGMSKYFVYVTTLRTPKPNQDYEATVIKDKAIVLKKIVSSYRITTAPEFYGRCFKRAVNGEENEGIFPQVLETFETIGINKDQCLKILQNAYTVDTDDIHNDGVSIEEAVKICKVVKLPFTSVFVLLPKNEVYIENKNDYKAGDLAYSMDHFIMEETEVKFSFDKINIDISDTEAKILMDVLTSLRKNK